MNTCCWISEFHQILWIYGLFKAFYAWIISNITIKEYKCRSVFIEEFVLKAWIKNFNGVFSESVKLVKVPNIVDKNRIKTFGYVCNGCI